LLDDRRIRVRTSDKIIRLRIREAQRLSDPTDPDPEHWSQETRAGPGWLKDIAQRRRKRRRRRIVTLVLA
jgi:hypothetical protein